MFLSFRKNQLAEQQTVCWNGDSFTEKSLIPSAFRFQHYKTLSKPWTWPLTKRFDRRQQLPYPAGHVGCYPSLANTNYWCLLTDESSSAGSLTGLTCERFSDAWAASSLQSSDPDLAPARYNPHPQPHYHHRQQHVPSVVYHRVCLPTFGSRSSAYWQDSSSLRCLCLYIHASRPAKQHMFLPSRSLHLGLPWCNQPHLYFLSVLTIIFLRLSTKNPLWGDFGVTESLICPVLIMPTESHRQTLILIEDKQ